MGTNTSLEVNVTVLPFYSWLSTNMQKDWWYAHYNNLDKNVISQSCTRDKLLLASESHSEPCQRFKVELFNNFGTRFWMVLWQLPPRKIAPTPNLNSNANPKPSPNKNRGAIFLRGNCPDTVLNTFLTLVPKLTLQINETFL